MEIFFTFRACSFKSRSGSRGGAGRPRFTWRGHVAGSVWSNSGFNCKKGLALRAIGDRQDQSDNLANFEKQVGEVFVCFRFLFVSDNSGNLAVFRFSLTVLFVVLFEQKKEHVTQGRNIRCCRGYLFVFCLVFFHHINRSASSLLTSLYFYHAICSFYWNGSSRTRPSLIKTKTKAVKSVFLI